MCGVFSDNAVGHASSPGTADAAVGQHVCIDAVKEDGTWANAAVGSVQDACRPEGEEWAICQDESLSNCTAMRKLLAHRDAFRVICAPRGFGKTSLVRQYANREIGCERVLWLDGGDPGFAVSLDEGMRLASGPVDAKQVSLVVIDDLPYLDEQRTRSLTTSLEALLKKDIEIVVCCTPANDVLGGILDRVSIGSADMPRVSKLSGCGQEHGGCPEDDGDGAQLDRCAPSPCPSVADESDGQLLAVEFAAERLPSDLMRCGMMALLLEHGTLDELTCWSNLPEEDLRWLAESYPFLGINLGCRRFSAVRIGVDAIAHAFETQGVLDQLGADSPMLSYAVGRLLDTRRLCRAFDAAMMFNLQGIDGRLVFLLSLVLMDEGRCQDAETLIERHLCREWDFSGQALAGFSGGARHLSVQAAGACVRGEGRAALSMALEALGLWMQGAERGAASNKGQGADVKATALSADSFLSGGDEECSRQYDAALGEGGQAASRDVPALPMLLAAVVVVQAGCDLVDKGRGMRIGVPGRPGSGSALKAVARLCASLSTRHGAVGWCAGAACILARLLWSGRCDWEAFRTLLVRIAGAEVAGRDLTPARLALHLCLKVLEICNTGQDAAASQAENAVSGILRQLAERLLKRLLPAAGCASEGFVCGLLRDDAALLERFRTAKGMQQVGMREVSALPECEFDTTEGQDAAGGQDVAGLLAGEERVRASERVVSENDPIRPRSGEGRVPLLRVELFGGLRVLADGEEIEPTLLEKRHSLGVLALLVLRRGREVPRLELAQAFWNPRGSRHDFDGLYSAWAHLRRSLDAILGTNGCPYLVRDGSEYRIDPRCVTSDVEEFEIIAKQLLKGGVPDKEFERRVTGLVCLKEGFDEGASGGCAPDEQSGDPRMRLFDRVDELYRGGFVGTLTATPSGGLFNRILRERMTDVMLAAATYASSLGQRRRASWFAGRAIEVGGMKEEFYRARMKAQIALGQRSSAFDTFFKMQRFLHEVQGLDPSRESSMLYQHLLEDGDAFSATPTCDAPGVLCTGRAIDIDPVDVEAWSHPAAARVFGSVRPFRDVTLDAGRRQSSEPHRSGRAHTLEVSYDEDDEGQAMCAS